MEPFSNPFRPGAGHMPPYLAGRTKEKDEFNRLLKQGVILENLILTGLRGTGKTVLLDTFKPMAISSGWFWAGNNLSETASVSEESLAVRILSDLSLLTSEIVVDSSVKSGIGFNSTDEIKEVKLTYDTLLSLYKNTPGLPSDKIKYVLEFVWANIRRAVPNAKGIIFAYDEAQNIGDNASKEQYPLSMLLDVFQSIQKKGLPLMLVFAGLPTLLPKLVDTRTYSERMFRVLTLERLTASESKDAIIKPISEQDCPVKFDPVSVEIIIKESGGYPYFIQFICKESYDVFLQKIANNEPNLSIPISEITNKLDNDFFAGRWMKTTDRQKELLILAASLENEGEAFSIQDIVGISKSSKNPFGSSQINQMLSVLITTGLIYKTGHGKYAFAVPLLGRYINRHCNLFSSNLNRIS